MQKTKKHSNILWLLPWCLFLCASWPSQAQWPLLEWTSQSEERPHAFLSPDDWSSESESDLLTYTKPLEWERFWHRSSSAYDLSAGSLSTFHLLVNSRLKAETAVNERWNFRFFHVYHEDTEQLNSHVILSVDHSINNRWRLGLAGEPRFSKQESDAALWVSGEWGRFSLSILGGSLDIPRGRHSAEDDRFLRRPLLAAARATWDNPHGLFVTTAIQWLSPSSRWIPSSEIQSESTQGRGQIMLIWPLPNHTSTVEGFLETERVRNHDSPSPDSTTPQRLQVRYKHRLDARIRQIDALGSPLTIETGVRFARRSFAGNQGTALLNETLPFSWLSWPAENSTWSLGGEATYHQSANAESVWEGRLNVRFSHAWSTRSEIIILGSVDLDDFALLGSFEGGNVQFRTEL